jgi:hypothetical protein
MDARVASSAQPCRTRFLSSLRWGCSSLVAIVRNERQAGAAIEGVIRAD